MQDHWNYAIHISWLVPRDAFGWWEEKKHKLEGLEGGRETLPGGRGPRRPGADPQGRPRAQSGHRALDVPGSPSYKPLHIQVWGEKVPQAQHHTKRRPPRILQPMLQYSHVPGSGVGTSPPNAGQSGETVVVTGEDWGEESKGGSAGYWEPVVRRWRGGRGPNARSMSH